MPDWESVALNGRRVYIAFDSDVMDKPEVLAALVRLKAFLKARGADVLVIRLPAGEGGTKIGLDDFLASGRGVEELLALAVTDLGDGAELGTDPGPYEVTPAGLIWRKPTKNGPVPVPLTNFTAFIQSSVAEDDGVEVRRSFEIEANLRGRVAKFSVPASQFASMNWPVEHLGAGAVVYPGLGLRDHARAAIQLLSGNVPERRVYCHTGWRQVDGAWGYLHANGAVGPIGPVGSISTVEVVLPEVLSRFTLPSPPSGERRREAIVTSLSLIFLAPDRVTVPLYAAIFRTVLGGADFALHLAGPTGAGKSELAALAQQHFGAGLDARHLPGSWSSTANALEGLAFQAKDALLVVDDFVPIGSSADVQRLHRDADRLLRNQGNQAGRLRMRQDATLRPAKPPRGLIVSTGEEIPRGQSLRARMFVLELGPSELQWEALSAAQAHAQAGIYAQALSGFLQWLVPRYADIRQRLRRDVEEYRKRAAQSITHRRTPEIVANLAAAFRYWLDYAVEAAALTGREADRLWEGGWAALGLAATAQTVQQESADPTQRFLVLLSAALASGHAHVANLQGGMPDPPEAWGWRLIGDLWRPQGDRIGWIGQEAVYLEPEASFAVVQRLGRDGGDSILVGSKTLHKRLHECGLPQSIDETRGRMTVRQTLEGQRRSVLHLHPSAIMSPEPTQPTQLSHPDS